MKLRKLSIEDGLDVYDLLQAIPAEENGYYNGAHGLTYEEFKEWLIKMDGYDRGENMPDWMVPSTEYWAEVDGTLVGNIRLRHYLTPALEEDGGHIGYAMAKAYRRKGYAKEMLKLLLPIAKEMGIERVLITPNTDNIASRKAVEANNGILEKENEHSCFYWIDL